MRCRNADNGTQAGDDDEDGDNDSSNLVATITATEAAIRIASDIIDSTLAHADDHGDRQNDNDAHNTTPAMSGMSFQNEAVTEVFLFSEIFLRVVNRTSSLFFHHKI